MTPASRAADAVRGRPPAVRAAGDPGYPLVVAKEITTPPTGMASENYCTWVRETGCMHTKTV